MPYRRWLALALLAVFAHPAVAADSPQVVLAVDVSRSLRAGELARTVAALQATVAAAPATTRWGLLAFADEPQWVVRPGGDAAAVSSGLATLAPTGRYTLLNDALFAAARELGDGGVLLVVSDGVDENSATTATDVATRCVVNGVRILTVGVGQRFDDRALRRLALLTGSRYLGQLDQLDANAVATALGEETAAVAEATTARSAAAAPPSRPAAPQVEAVGAPPPPAATAPTTRESTAPTDGDAATGSSSNLWLVGLGLLAAGAIVGILVARRRRDPEPQHSMLLGQLVPPAPDTAVVAAPSAPPVCPRCGTDLPRAGAPCPRCTVEERERSLRARPSAPIGAAREVRADTAVFFKVPFEEAIEKTFVMTEQVLLDVKEPGEPRRSYLLPQETAFQVGRDAKLNTLGITDPTLSLRHFRIVAEDGSFYVLDEHSTNGTFVNGERAGAARPLHSGDVIQAGQVEFTFRVQQERLG